MSNGTTVEHMVLVGRDITQRVLMEREQAALRDRRERFFGAAPVGILTTDVEGKIDFANQWMTDILGYVGPEILRDRNLLGLDAVKQMALADDLLKVLIEGAPLTREQIPCVSAQGRDMILNVRAEPFSDQHGTIMGLVAVIEDVTEKHRLRTRLSATTADLAMLAEIGAIFQESRDSDMILRAVLVGITAGEGLGFNRALFLAADGSRKQLKGRFAIGPVSAEEAWETWGALARQRRTLYEMAKDYQEAAGADASPINALVQKLNISLEDVENVVARVAAERRAHVVSDARSDPMVPKELSDQLGSDSFAVVPLVQEGSVHGVIVADNAITKKPISSDDLRSLELFATQAMLAMERARLYSELERRLQEVQEANVLLKENQATMLRMSKMEAIGQMAAQVAHEIRNPMTAIGGFARTVLKSLEPGNPNRAFLQIIVDETTRLERILRDVLDFSRTKSVRLAPVDLADLLRRIVGMMQGEILKRRIKTRVSLPKTPVMVEADADQIRQVVHNLVQNALDAMAKENGGKDDTEEENRLTVSLTVRGAHAVASVEDTGSGLSPDAMDRIFEPFFTTKNQGTGLGLSICRQIVLDHGGDISFANNEHGGATFFLALPYSTQEEANGTDTGS